MKKKVFIPIIILFVLLVASTSWSYFNINSIKGDLQDLFNNQAFSEASEKISESTVLMMIEKDSYDISDQVSGGIYVDDEGIIWGTGTAFSIGNGAFLSASHILSGESNMSKIKLVWGGEEYKDVIEGVFDAPDFYLVVLKTNLNVPSVNFIKEGMASLGAKVGLIGYPLGETTQILHDGIVSSTRTEEDGFFWYTINSFVNKGNSGGPVFLSDTGEVIGVVSSKQYESLAVPPIDESKLSEGEKELLKIQMFISSQLMVNSQIGIGRVVGINQIIVDNIKKSIGLNLQS